MKILNVKFKISRSFETSVDLVSSQLCWIIIIVCRLVDCTNIIIGMHFSEKELRLNVDKKTFKVATDLGLSINWYSMYI